MENGTFFNTLRNVERNRTRKLGDTLSEVNEPYTHILAVVFVILSIIGTIENGLVLIAMCKYKVLRSPTMFFIGALATIDLLTSAIVMPFYVHLTLNPSWSWHKANIVIMGVVVSLSLLTAVYISMDRFAHVYYLQKYNMTLKKSIFCLVLLWIVPFVLVWLIRVLVYKLVNIRAAWSATRGTAVVLIILCIVTIAGSYAGIMILLRNHAKKMKDTMQSSYLNNQSRATKTALIVVFCVILMNTPTLAYTILVLSGKEAPNWFCSITLVTLLSSSALNPMVYLLRLPLVQEHVLKLIGCQGDRPGNDDEAGTRLTSQSGHMSTEKP